MTEKLLKATLNPNKQQLFVQTFLLQSDLEGIPDRLITKDVWKLQNLETLDIASIHIILSKQRTTKKLIRLRGFSHDMAHLIMQGLWKIQGPSVDLLYQK